MDRLDSCVTQPGDADERDSKLVAWVGRAVV